MKRERIFFKIMLGICVFLLTINTNAQSEDPCTAGGQTCYFGVKMDSVLFGYSVARCCNGIINGSPVRFEYTDVKLKMSLFGSDFDGGFKWKFTIDPVTERPLDIESTIINGESVITTVTSIKDDTAWFSSPASGVNKTIPLDGDVIFDTQMRYPNLYDDFIVKGAVEKIYKVYDPVKGEIIEKAYTRKAEEPIMLNDSSFQALVIEETNLATGVKTTLWLNEADGFNLKAFVDGRTVFLADKSVMGRIRSVNMDNILLAKVNKKITDIAGIKRMRVKARLNSYGEKITPASLNATGQKFEGTVTGNLIDGIFEMEPVGYTGEDAPPFPCDYSKYNGLDKYLNSELLIESDDSLIISEAVRITSGSKDAWEAATRLCKWVTENIHGALPGGISAINSLKTKEAECGGHSRLLVALCRAVGIPARMVIGCMYSAQNTGSFSQHAWTEVYMGDAGWIPVDATINESDNFDAGHIRLGEDATFRPVSMEILDYRTAEGNPEAVIPDSLRPLLGNYMNIRQYRMFKIIFRNGGLAIDIPGRIVLDLNKPDEKGLWYPRLTREISLKPENIADGRAGGMILHQYIRLIKKSSPEKGLDSVPGELRELVGNYQFTPARISLDVMADGGMLTTQDPAGESKDRISYMKEGDKWIDVAGRNILEFVANSENKVTGMILTTGTEFLRGEPVTNAVEPVIYGYGVDAGLKKYDEIKESGDPEYLFSEDMLHQLGYKLLNENRVDDAVRVFEKNVQEYPGSFIANKALAETYFKNGESNLALNYFEKAVKIDSDYEYGMEMINKLRTK